MAGLAESRLAMNCSGKHAGMLLACLHNGWPVSGYLAPSHPLQQLLAATVAELTGEPVPVTAVDGCGAPLFGISLNGLAKAFGTLASAPSGTPEHKIANAMNRHPEWVGGTGRDVTALMRAVPGLLAKDGAEGVQVAALPDGRTVAVKVADGSGRARTPVTVGALRAIGVDVVADAFVEPVLGHGEPVGRVVSLVGAA
jgi:L-asparaginase II